jgi:shikimate dehydrogenase
MKTLALLGHPISHSVSPVMHNAAASALGLNYQYVAQDISPDLLSDAISNLRLGKWVGANVTIPHKKAVIPLLDELGDIAKAVGAVNTLIRVDDRIHGENTDIEGFLMEIDSLEINLTNRPALILGTGGSARAVAFALLQRASEVRLLGRNIQAGTQIAYDLHQITGGNILRFDWNPIDLRQASQDCALVVNCTPIGMVPNVNNTPWFPSVPFPPKTFVYDLVYNPIETMLVKQARSNGIQAHSGLGMLVRQGALSFTLWTGHQPPMTVMLEAAERELND